MTTIRLDIRDRRAPSKSEIQCCQKCNDEPGNRMKRKRLKNNLTNRRAREVVLAARLHHAQGIILETPRRSTPISCRGQPPRGFERHVFERTFEVQTPNLYGLVLAKPRRDLHQGQVPPYRVEFIPNRFEVGVLTSHHGPGLSFSGIIDHGCSLLPRAPIFLR